MKVFIKLLITASVIFLLVACVSAYKIYGKSIINTVFAEDDDEEEEDDDDHYDVIDTNPSNSGGKKNETKTITTKLADTITQTTTTTVKYDSDGDGKYNEEDPHPTINEYFIVKDDNLNGIDNQYEQ